MDQYPGLERRWCRRLAWAVVAQAASSLTNFTLYLGLLASSATADFGRWVAVLAVYHLVVALSRSLMFEPMVASARARGRRSRSGGVGGSFSWAWARRRSWVVGAVGAAGAVVVGSRVGADPPSVGAVALSLPFLVRQDGQRALAWARGRPGRAVALDGVWLGVTGLLLGTALVWGSAGAEVVALCWVSGGLASTVVGRLLVEWGPTGASTSSHPVAGMGADHEEGEDRDRDGGGAVGSGLAESWLHARRRSQGLLTAGRSLLPIAVATVAGPTAAGLLKAALLPYTPVLSLLAGLRMVILPGMQRAADGRSVADLDRFVTRVAAAHLVVGGAAIAASLAVVVTVGPDPGPDGVLQPDLVAWGAVVAVIISVTSPLADGAGLGRRSVGRAGLGRRSGHPAVSAVGRRLVEIGVEWSLVLGAAILFGADLVVVGWAVGVALGSLLWLAPGLRPERPERGRHPSVIQK